MVARLNVIARLAVKLKANSIDNITNSQRNNDETILLNFYINVNINVNTFTIAQLV